MNLWKDSTFNEALKYAIISRLNTPRQTLLTGTFLTLAVAYCWTLLSWAGVVGPDLLGVIPRQQASDQAKWKTIEQREVSSGSTIPAQINVLFHIPSHIKPILRLTLLGPESKNIRYWGYCFVRDTDPPKAAQTRGLPGKVFLSEAERAWRRQREEAMKPVYSIYNPPTRRGDLQQRVSINTIRHQLETFQPGATCYIMTEKPLPIGTDQDGDGVNIKIEKEKTTDPNNPDTDGDGVLDGLEIWSLKTDPKRRDTDGDALIDGVEDANLNGIFESNETNPTNPDTDSDGLCDGDCRIYEDRKLCKDNAGFDCVILPFGYWRGEDRNLNGTVDQGETDPRKADTDGDGIRDDQEYFNCVLQQQKNC
jgi:hypothetical protein